MITYTNLCTHFQQGGKFVKADFYGLSTDTKPTSIGESAVWNGSTFFEMNTGKVFIYDQANSTWREV